MSNKLKIAIAGGIATSGISHGEAVAAVIGPLVEALVLIARIRVSLWLKGSQFKKAL